MLKIVKNLFIRNSPCRALQKIESQKFTISGDCLEIGSLNLNKKVFLMIFLIRKQIFFFVI